jgi:hypothetical protein
VYNSISQPRKGYAIMPRTQEQERVYYAAHKAEYCKRAQELKARRRKFVRDQKIGKSCNICGESRPYCLDYHHPNNNKEGGLCQLAHKGVSEAILLEEINKCILVCRNCHAEIHWKEKYNEFF